MKRTLYALFIVLTVILVGVVVLAQDNTTHFQFTGSHECDTLLNVQDTTDNPVLLILTYGETGQEIERQYSPYEFRVPAGRTAYTLIAEYAPEDQYAYTIQGRQECPPPVDEYLQLQSAMFAQMNWGEEEIEWFYQMYPVDGSGMYGSPQDYIYGVATGFAQLNEAMTPEPIVVTPTPEPEPTLTLAPEPTLEPVKTQETIN